MSLIKERVSRLINNGALIPLFDIDWTLLRGNPENKIAHNQAFDYALKTVYRLDQATVAGRVLEGMIDSQILIEIATQSGVSEEEAKSLVNPAMVAMVDYFQKNANQGEYTPMPGALNLLEQLSKISLPLGLLTGNVEEIGWEKVKRANLEHFFDFGAFGSLALRRVDLVPIAKHRAEKILGIQIPMNQLAIIGDSPLDIKCARDAGITVLAVGAGHYPPSELTHADLVVDTLEEADKILDFLRVN